VSVVVAGESMGVMIRGESEVEIGLDVGVRASEDSPVDIFAKGVVGESSPDVLLVSVPRL